MSKLRLRRRRKFDYGVIIDISLVALYVYVWWVMPYTGGPV